MRGRLATTAGYRSPPLPEGERLKPFPLWGKLKEGTRPKGASEGRGGAEQSSPLPTETLAQPACGQA